jgi:tetratricopeptide (TPR) repeat protein
MKPTSRSALLAVALALAAFDAAAQTPKATNPLTIKGWETLNAGKVDEGLAMLQKAAQSGPSDPFTLAWLGVALVRKGGIVEPAEAPAWVKKGFNSMDEAVESFPNIYVGYLSRGTAAIKVPDIFKKAPAGIEDLQHIVAMKEKDPKSVPDSDMPNVYLNLGIGYKKTGHADQARATWEKAKKLYPSDPAMANIDKELRTL